jgi:cytochrome c
MAKHDVQRRLAAMALAAAALICAAAAAPVARAEGDAAAGEKVFKRSCAFCHSLDATTKKQGPHLDGLIGRQAGSVSGFAYSKGLAQSNITWSPETLDTYLAAPRKLVPDTKMAVGLPNAKDRQDLIAYLGSLAR